MKKQASENSKGTGDSMTIDNLVQNGSMLLGGVEHNRHMESEKDSLFWLSEQKGMLSTAMELYATVLVGYQRKTFEEKDNMPDWYHKSRAVQALRNYVSGLWRMKR